MYGTVDRKKKNGRVRMSRVVNRMLLSHLYTIYYITIDYDTKKYLRLSERDPFFSNRIASSISLVNIFYTVLVTNNLCIKQ